MQRTVFIPRMSDHAFAAGAALRGVGIPAEVLPLPDDETLAIGLDLCKGRECSPCFLCTGDFVRRASQPGFDPAAASVLMPTTAGPCRFGQYSTLLRNVLDEQGLGEVTIVAPSGANSYRDFGEKAGRVRALFWQGTVAVDLLLKLLHQYRPYELEPGAADRVYESGRDRMERAVERGGGRELVEAMRRNGEEFAALRVDRSELRPRIGIVGEIYLRFNAFGNQDIVRQVEAVGGEATLASLMEWLYFTNWQAKDRARINRRRGEWLKVSLVDLYQRRVERRLARTVSHLLRHPLETPTSRLMANIRPFYEPRLGTEAVLSMGKAIEFARQGMSGILSIMPFSCMPGIIVAGMAPRIRADLQNIPWLDLAFDAQGGTNVKTRLEAFMHQARQFHRGRERGRSVPRITPSVVTR